MKGYRADMGDVEIHGHDQSLRDVRTGHMAEMEDEMSKQSTDGIKWDRFWGIWRWRIAVIGVVAVTYVAIYFAMYLNPDYIGVKFVITAFPAAIAQFVIIDMARNGLKVKKSRDEQPL
jgi:anti-sigma-K factor RskA